ncbi:vicilin-like seed storage protein [Cucumis melo var. makuwa]|uniref:Vicilin-like seed storage protein n=1 Tax=Cucumis melo var. makuwa TaxID=1194695 RepID=A0A5D3CNA8_CUCMM|nr:vicilin-like seed storage protein [Cucumis melo var. makuwa]
MKKPTAISVSGSPFSLSFLISIFFLFFSLPAYADDGWWEGDSPVVKRANERIQLLKTEYGDISAVDFDDGSRFGPYHLQFITLEPNSLFLPVLLHSDMVFYIHTGSGRLNWFDENDLKEVDLRRGDLYRLHPGSIFYLQSSLEIEREKLRIYALFSSTDEDSFNPSLGAYSRVTDLVRGFGKEVLRKAFMAPDEVIEEIMTAKRPPLIVHAAAPTPSIRAKSSSPWEFEARLLKAFLGGDASGIEFNKKKKKKKGIYNVYEVDPDFENCNGWSLTVTKKNSHQLKGSNIGFLVVNLTAGSMMGPHWNPRAWEIGIVTSDEPGVVHVGCSSTSANSSKCKNWSFVVEKGDIFVVPRFHPMAQMSFNNGTFVFVGFSTTNGHNMPQFFVGSSSVLQLVDREVLAWSFDVNVTTVDRLLKARVESIILECTSCAEEEVRKMEEEAEREREEEEERKREEEEQRKREEEEQRKREEEERRKREEEEQRKREEEEQRKREEEERRKREEEEEAEREEERKREEEEAQREEERRRRREEEEKREKEREEEEQRRREEEEQQQEEEEAQREEERRRRREEEERKREEEEGEKEREEEQQQEEEEAKREEEEERKREEEREAKREEEEAREREEEHQRERGRRRREAEEGQRRRWEEEEGEGEEEEEEQPVLRILSQWT